MKTRRVVLGLVVLACLLIGGCVYWRAMAGGTAAGTAIYSEAIREHNRPKPLADFNVALFDGKQKRAGEFVGKPLVVNFWADWCPPCVGELPEFQAVYNERRGQFQMLGIAADSSKDAEGFVKQFGYNWTFGRSPEGFKAYEVRGIPMTLFVNKEGYVIDQVVGGMDRATFEEKLNKIL